MENIAKAISAVMSEIHGVKKGMTVGTGVNSYKGVSDKDVKEKIRVSMIDNGLSILPIGGTPKIQIDRWEQEDFYQGQSQGIKTKQSIFTDIETRYLLLHTSGESIEVYGYGQGVDARDKGAGKATTYALKNTLLNMFLIPTGVDTDDTHSDDYDVPKKQFKKTETIETKQKPKSSTDGSCPDCGIMCENIQSGTTKDGRPYTVGTCECGTKFFINKK